MEQEKIYKRDYEIRFYDCTPKGKARISTILKVMGDYAGLDYTERGYGHDILWEKGMVFLLCRVSVHFERFPSFDEKVTVTTWEHGIKGPMFYRYFEILDENKNVIMDAKTAWLLVNPTTRKILKPNTFYGEYKMIPEKLVVAVEPDRIKLPQTAQKVGERVTYYSDLDDNGHMNNSVYADIAVDFLDKELREKQISDFIINYNHEALVDNILEIKMFKDNDGVIIGGDFKSIEDKVQNCFTTKLIFKK